MARLRDSNFELLRVIAIILVLLLHADFFAIEGPNVDAIISKPVDSTLCIMVQSISVIAVDVFVMISGWFGINPTKRGVFNLLFQILFYLVIIYVIAVCLGFTVVSSQGLKDIVLATSSNWFIKAYVVLYIFAPLLNHYVNSASQSEFRGILVAFFLFQTVYGLIFPKSTDYIRGGYSPLSFMGLYLLVRYVKIYRPNWTNGSVIRDVIAIGSIILGVTAICVVPALWGLDRKIVYGYSLLSYISPTTILVALLSIIAISKIRFNSVAINRLGTSSFAVYLVFVNPNILTPYKYFFRDLHLQFSGIYYWALTLIIVILLYLTVACIDSIRIILQRNIQSVFRDYIGYKYETNRF